MASSNNGKLRAYRTLALLALHRRGRVDDDQGQATQTLQFRAGITLPVAADGMSQALHYLRRNQLVIADVGNGSRCYSIELAGKLTPDSLASLTRDEHWARCFVNNKHYEGPAIGQPVDPKLIETKEDSQTTLPGLEPFGEPESPAAQLDHETRITLLEGSVEEILRLVKQLTGASPVPAARMAVPRPSLADAEKRIASAKHPLGQRP
jgi:hypothetical protein